MKTCFLFPGQGAQYPGMGKDLWEADPSIKSLFSQASEAADMDLEKLLFHAGAEDLQATDKAQIAITLVCLCSSRILRAKGIVPEGCAGFSLGEYAALHEAGIIGLEQLFPLVKIRGQLMEKAARSLDAGAEKPGMAAVMGLDSAAVLEVVSSLSPDGVFAANFNSPVQTVLSGTHAGLAKAEAALKAAGAKRFIRLKVSGPFHSPLMSRAAADFAEALKGFAFSDPAIPVYSNVTGERIRSGEEARELCARQVVSPVQWVNVEKKCIEDGFRCFLEAGPGTVLAGLFKALEPGVDIAPAGRREDIEKIIASGSN